MHKAATILLMAMLLSGCTINPQDSVPAPGSPQINYPGGSGTGSAQNGTQKLFTLEEVAKHGTKEDCWLVIGNKVLGLTGFTTHPGGDAYVPYCGKNATEGFAAKGGAGGNHSEYAIGLIDSFVIGEIGKPMQDDGANASGAPDSQSGGGSAGTGGGGAEAGGSGETGNQSSGTASQIILTIEEVARHGAADDCWMVIYGKVLNLTAFSSHPGGSAYVPFCGTDATAAFDTKGGRGNAHSGTAVADLAAFTIGELGQPQNRTIDAANVTIPRGDDDDWNDDEEDDD